MIAFPSDNVTANGNRYWVVLDQGRLSEYINWKQSLERHMNPIDLRMASVREARNADRRFCFEVITPQFSRVYQATSEVDMKSWIQAINNALQSAFEDEAPPHEPRSAGHNSASIARELFGKSSSFHGHRSTSSSNSNAQTTARNVTRHVTVGDRPLISRAHSNEEKPGRLLQTIRDADAGNAWCADCNSDSRVEWVSINLGIIVCIECSGIHRSLGTHISKVRSLTLDTVSFTQDIIELLLQIGNRVSNMVWEATLDRSLKLNPQASREQRLRFVTAKYADFTYVQPNSRYASVDDALLTSIKKNDIQAALYALAIKANPNASDKSRATHAVFLALAAADPASPLPSLPGQPLFSSVIASSAHPPEQRKSFPLAELLLQNGAEIPNQPAPIPLSNSALMYLDFKNQQKLGRVRQGLNNATNALDGNGDRLTALPLFGGGDSRELQKLAKRNSRDISRMVRSVGLT